MGATLPTLTRFLTQGDQGLAGAFQRLYAANTVGAIVGTAIAGFRAHRGAGPHRARSSSARCAPGPPVSSRCCSTGARRRRAGTRCPRARAGPRIVGPDALPGGGRCQPPPTRADARVHLGAHVARVPGRVEPPASARDGQLHVRVHGHPDALPRSASRFGAVLLGVLRTRVRSPLMLIAVGADRHGGLRRDRRGVLASPPFPMPRRRRGLRQRVAELRPGRVHRRVSGHRGDGHHVPGHLRAPGGQRGPRGRSTGTLLAINTAGSITATFALPFFVIPLIGSPATLAALAIINAVVGGVLLYTFRVGDDRPARSRAGSPGSPWSVLVVVLRPHGRRLPQPDDRAHRGQGRHRLRSHRGRDCERGGGRDRRLPAALGRRHLDDCDHRGREVHAPAAADAAARDGQGARHRLRHGDGLPHVAQRRRSRRTSVELVPSRPRHVPVVLRRRRCGACGSRAAR